MTNILKKSDFTVYSPVASKKYDIVADLVVPDDVEIKILRGNRLMLRLPALFGTVTTDATTAEGSLALGNDFVKPTFWDLTQVIAVYDATGGTYLSYNATAASSADLAAGEWGYDESTNTVFFKTAAVSSNVYVYAIPFAYPVKIECEIRQPGAKIVRTPWMGSTADFIVRDLVTSPVTFTENVILKADDRIVIRVTSENQSKPFTPYLPDGSTLLKIFDIMFYVRIGRE